MYKPNLTGTKSPPRVIFFQLCSRTWNPPRLDLRDCFAAPAFSALAGQVAHRATLLGIIDY